MNRFPYGTPRFGHLLPAFLSTLHEFLSGAAPQPVPVSSGNQAPRLRGVRRYPVGYSVQR